MEAVGAEKHDALRCVVAVQASLATKHRALQVGWCATEELQTKHDVVLSQMRNETREDALVESGIPPFRK